MKIMNIIRKEVKPLHFWRTPGEFIVLCGLGLAVYAPTLNAPYLYDDHRVIAMSRTLLQEAENVSGAPRSADATAMPLWKQPRPLRQLSHAADQALFGDSAHAAHVVNVLLHALVSFLGCRLLRQIGMTHNAALLAGALFLALPICVESVAIVSHRKEMLAAIFLLLGLGFAERKGRPAWIPAMLCFALAVTGKETALVFPLLYLIIRFAGRLPGSPPRAFPEARTVRHAAMLLGLSIVLALASWMQIRAGVEVLDSDKLSLGSDRFGHLGPGTSWITVCKMAAWAFARFLLMMASPGGHALHPPMPNGLNSNVLASALPLLAIAGFMIAVAASWRRRSDFLPPLSWIAASLSLVLFPPLLRSGATAIYADRYAYLASFGFAWLVVVALGHIRLARLPNASLWLAIPLLAVYGVGANLHARHFVTETALWTHVVSRNPGAYQAHFNLARDAWKGRGDREEALSHYRRMSKINPGFVFGHCAFSEFMAEVGSMPEAIEILDDCLAHRPDSPQLHAQRGVFHLKQGLVDAAADDFAQAVRLGGDDPVMLHNYGMALESRAEWRKAAALYARAARHPGFRKDAMRAKLLTEDPPPSRKNHDAFSTLVAGMTVLEASEGSDETPPGRLAEALNQRFIARGGRGKPFLPLAAPGGSGGAIASAISQRLGPPTRIANCVLMISPSDTARFGGPDALVQTTSRCVTASRINGTRPLLVWLGPSGAPTALSTVSSSSEALSTLRRLRAFCEEANIILIAPGFDSVPDMDAQDNPTTLSFERIVDPIIALLTAERRARPPSATQP